MGQPGEVGTRWVIQEVWVVGGRRGLGADDSDWWGW